MTNPCGFQLGECASMYSPLLNLCCPCATNRLVRYHLLGDENVHTRLGPDACARCVAKIDPHSRICGCSPCCSESLAVPKHLRYTEHRKGDNGKPIGLSKREMDAITVVRCLFTNGIDFTTSVVLSAVTVPVSQMPLDLIGRAGMQAASTTTCCAAIPVIVTLMRAENNSPPPERYMV